VAESSNLHGFELHRPSSKDTKLLFQVIQAIIHQVQIHMDSSSRFDVTVLIFCFLFLEENFARKKKSRNVRSYTRPTVRYVYTHVFLVHIYEYIYVDKSRLSPSGFFGPSDSRCHGLIPTPGLKCTAEYPTYSVCLCIYAHVHQHTLQTQSKNRGN